MNVLVIKLSALGDVVMSLPFLEALRRTWPGARLTWVVEEAAAGLLVGHPHLDRIIVFGRRRWLAELKKGRPASALRQALAFRRELRRETYDVVVDLQGLLKSGILIFSSRGRRKIGFDRTRELNWVFLNEKLPPYDPDRHAVLRYLDAAAHLGADISGGPVFHLPPDAGAATQAAALLAGAGSPLVAVNPGAKWSSKLWPAGHWIKLCRRAFEELGAAVVLTGSADEAGANAGIAGGAPGTLDLTGRTGLKVLAEVFRRADVVVGPDTGPVHLAAAVGTKVVALFGPTAPWRTGPWGEEHTVIRLGRECSPCRRKDCPEPRCMSEISPEAVLAAVRETLG
ncbi:MAG: glycosyltransferase family 9 protein [Thermodesulfobacteriota bacterium]